jgi:hypothetical protein
LKRTGKKRNAYRILVGKLEGTKELDRCTYMWEYTSGRDLKEKG